MLATAVWSFAYALELSAMDNSHRELWGGLKYVGITVLPAAWLIFALQYTGRIDRPSTKFLGALAIEPVVVLALLAAPGTRHLVRFYPAGSLQPFGGSWLIAVWRSARVWTIGVACLRWNAISLSRT